MSESNVETMRVVSEVSDDNPHGYIVINAEDFKAEIHKNFDVAESQEVVTESKRGRKPKQVES